MSSCFTQEPAVKKPKKEADSKSKEKKKEKPKPKPKPRNERSAVQIYHTAIGRDES